MDQRVSDPDIVAMKRYADEDMVTYLRIKLAESDSRMLLKVKERTC